MSLILAFSHARLLTRRNKTAACAPAPAAAAGITSSPREGLDMESLEADA
jgi:hypothetical protein